MKPHQKVSRERWTVGRAGCVVRGAWCVEQCKGWRLTGYTETWISDGALVPASREPSPQATHCLHTLPAAWNATFSSFSKNRPPTAHCQQKPRKTSAPQKPTHTTGAPLKHSRKRKKSLWKMCIKGPFYLYVLTFVLFSHRNDPNQHWRDNFSVTSPGPEDLADFYPKIALHTQLKTPLFSSDQEHGFTSCSRLSIFCSPA